MRQSSAALGSAAFFVAAPGTVVGLGPWLITRWRLPDAATYSSDASNLVCEPPGQAAIPYDAEVRSSSGRDQVASGDTPTFMDLPSGQSS